MAGALTATFCEWTCRFALLAKATTTAPCAFRAAGRTSGVAETSWLWPSGWVTVFRAAAKLRFTAATLPLTVMEREWTAPTLKPADVSAARAAAMLAGVGPKRWANWLDVSHWW